MRDTPTPIGVPLFARNFANGLSELNYSVHLSEEFNFVFFNNPKCGCSTTKATLNLEVARRLGVPLAYASTTELHSRPHNPLKTPVQIGWWRFAKMLADPATVRFCVLREPVSRVLSAFTNKFGGDTPQRRRFNARLGLAPTTPWNDVNAFVEAIASDHALRDSDEHWRLQFKQVCGALVDFTMVGFQEELEPFLRSVARRVFKTDEIDIFDARDSFPTNRSDSRAAREQLTPRSRALLLRAYADDVVFYRTEKARMAESLNPPS
jgi:sulfotransferase famil protein